MNSRSVVLGDVVLGEGASGAGNLDVVVVVTSLLPRAGCGPETRALLDE